MISRGSKCVNARAAAARSAAPHQGGAGDPTAGWGWSMSRRLLMRRHGRTPRTTARGTIRGAPVQPITPRVEPHQSSTHQATIESGLDAPGGLFCPAQRTSVHRTESRPQGCGQGFAGTAGLPHRRGQPHLAPGPASAARAGAKNPAAQDRPARFNGLASPQPKSIGRRIIGGYEVMLCSSISPLGAGNFASGVKT